MEKGNLQEAWGLWLYKKVFCNCNQVHLYKGRLLPNRIKQLHESVKIQTGVSTDMFKNP